MKTQNIGPAITQLEFDDADFERAKSMARKLGYTQTAYTTSSALWGLFCLRDHARMRAGCIIKTREFGLLFVQDCEDLNIEEEKLRPLSIDIEIFPKKQRK